VDIYNFIINEFKTNDMLVGLIGGSFSVGIMYAVRTVPEKIFGIIRRLFISEIEITNDRSPTNFKEVLQFIQANYSLLLRQDTYRGLFFGAEMKPLLGYGNHLFSVLGKPCIVSYHPEDGNSVAEFIKETLTIYVLTIDGAKFFLEMFCKLNESRTPQLKIFLSVEGYWRETDSPQPRPLCSLVFPCDFTSNITSKVASFLNNKDWYIEKGIPRNLSFLFEGPPGTGKTSMAIALATEFKLKLFSLSLGGIRTDSALLELLSGLHSDCVLLIEDVDCVGIPDRDSKTEGLTMSGILNSLDGVASPQGRILIMTTNHKEKLDPALIRPGRVDHIITFKNLNKQDSQRLYEMLGAKPPVNGNGISPAGIVCAAKENIGV